MTTILTTQYGSTASPKHAPISQQLPDSPDDVDRYNANSDDLQPTSNLYVSSLDVKLLNRHHNLVVIGSYEKTVTLGRGGSNTIKIGRRNRQISRTHVSIAYNEPQQQFELLVIGLNGACVDQIQYAQHDLVTLDNDSFIDILGDHFHFKIPPPRLNFNQIEQEKVIIYKKNDIFDRELSPEVEYPVELVPEEPLSADEKELSPEPLSEDEKELSPPAEKRPLQEKNQVAQEDTNDYAQVIIDALVFSRTSSMPISDICSRILKGNPVYAKQPRALWIERIRTVLKQEPFFGEIQRKGKTADGSPTENLYYYHSELDPVEWRRATYTQVGRSARKCTLKDKQYFWKIPPKLGRHRSAYIPPPADIKRQRSDHDENVDPKKTRIL